DIPGSPTSIHFHSDANRHPRLENSRNRVPWPVGTHGRVVLWCRIPPPTCGENHSVALPWIKNSLPGDDVEILAAHDGLKRLQAQAGVADAFPCLDVVFIAVPGADEMRFIFVKTLAPPGLVRAEHVFDLVHDDAFAARASLVQAKVQVGEKGFLPVEYPD